MATVPAFASAEYEYSRLGGPDKTIHQQSACRRDDIVINFGGGITLGTEAEFHIEARYHYVWGPEVKPDPHFPLTFGFRF
jgi:hypothetical protein